MAIQDEEFMARLQSTFKAEAEELLQSISTMLLELEKLPASALAATIIENVFREAHTLKGAARAVDLPDIEAICQQVEGIFSSWKRKQSVPSPETFDSLHHSVDMMRALLPSGKKVSADTRRRQDELIQRLDRLQSQPPVTTLQDEPAKLASASLPLGPPSASSAASPQAKAERAPPRRLCGLQSTNWIRDCSRPNPCWC